MRFRAAATAVSLVIATAAGLAGFTTMASASPSAFSFEDGTTQGWHSLWGANTETNSTVRAWAGTHSLAIAFPKAAWTAAGSAAVIPAGTQVTYNVWSPTAGYKVKPFIDDSSWHQHWASEVSLASGWNSITWTTSGATSMMIGLQSDSSGPATLYLDEVSWPGATPTPTPTPSVTPTPTPTPTPTGTPPAGDVVACGTKLCLNGQPYQFDGFNNDPVCNPGDSRLDGSFTAQAGAEAARSWFLENTISAGGTLNWAPFDQYLATANAHGIKVIITLGNQWTDCVNSGYKTLAWYQGGYKSTDGDGPLSYRDYVQAVVSRYAGNPAILAWQMMNEAEASTTAGGSCNESAASSALRSFSDDIGGLIHNLDPGHLVSLGTIGGGQCGTQGADYQTVMASPGVDLCEYHDYGQPTVAMPGDQFNGLQVRLNQCGALNKPLFVGETGIMESDAGSQAQRAADFDAKFAAQFSAGVSGELIWAFNLNGSGTNFDVGPGDPTMALLTKY